MAQHYTPIWDDWAEVTQELTAEEKGRLMDAIVAYDNGDDWQGIIQGNERFVFPGYKARLDRYNEACQAKKKPESNDQEQTEQKKQKIQNPSKKSEEDKSSEIPKVKDKDKVKDQDKKTISATAPDTNRRFDKFWGVYPRKEGKQAARKAFDRLEVDDGMLEVMVAAIVRQKQSDQWSDPRYIPHPATWLNGRRWEDETTGPGRKTVSAQRYQQRDYQAGQLEDTLGVVDLFREAAS